ncbi:MAG TPA: hypothetical protein VFM21_11050, partial [Terriglobia bacterium]|nr:hypothetical protein [Terriglobia bacterium]
VPAGEPFTVVTYETPSQVNLGKVSSLQFLVRSDGHSYKFQLVRWGSSADRPEMTLVPYTDWRKIALPWPWEDPNQDLTRASPWLLQISVAGPAGDFHLDIDQIEYAGVPAREGTEPVRADAPHK